MAKDKKDDKDMENLDANVEVELKKDHETDKADADEQDDDTDEKDDKKCKDKKNCDESIVKKREVSELNISEDVQLLFNGQELSEEFKQRATTIFEAAVLARVNAEIEKIEVEAQDAIALKVNEAKEEIVSQTDEYLSKVVTEWAEENKVALESGMRQEIAESFIEDLAKLFEKHNIFVPEAKVDALDEAVEAIDILKDEVATLNEALSAANEVVHEMRREKILVTVSEGLALTQKDRLNSLVKEIDAKDLAVFEEKVKTIKQSMFTEDKKVSAPVNEAKSTSNNDKLFESLKKINNRTSEL